MSDYNIVKADFEKQKTELKKFAEQPATSTELDKFSTSGKFSDFLSGGLLGLIDHKVTGEEMNELVTELQTCFAEINERDRKVIKEFGQVYETFEALDKGYIQGILIGVKSAEEASKEAKNAQKDINDTIEALRKTVQKLKEFKDQVNSHKHLKDIDEMWTDLETLEISINDLSSDLDQKYVELQQKIDDLNEYKASLLKIAHLKDIDNMFEALDKAVGQIAILETDVKDISTHVTNIVETFDKLQLDQISHLTDIDEMWEDLKKFKGSSDSQFKKINEAIIILKEFSESQNHFGDVDHIWDLVKDLESKANSSQDDIKEILEAQSNQVQTVDNINITLSGFVQQEHAKEIDDEWAYSHSLGERLIKEEERTANNENQILLFQEQMQTAESENLTLRNKIKMAYYIAGGAIALSVLQLILSIVGVL